MFEFKDRKVQYAVVIGLIAAITLMRVAVEHTGPLYLIPVVIAALWLGRWPGLAAGAVSASAILLDGGTTDLSGDAAPDSPLAAELVRLLIFGAVGYGVGVLSERRVRLERALLETELELEELHTLQSALAPPEPPERPHLELATCYIAAEQGVSGDFYVVMPAPDDSTFIAVGDVAGRGLDAAKRAWYVRTLLASSADITYDPATVLERANRGLISDAGFDTRFVTAACILFRPDGEIEWALAGHDGPVRLDTGERLRGDGSSGLPLGVSDQLGCETSRASLAAGGGLLLYTDGLTEARRGSSRAAAGVELFGEERIESLLAAADGAASADVLERVRDEIHEFSGGELADDLCMVALRLAGEGDATEVCSPERVEILTAG